MPGHLDPSLHELLQRRLIATLGTENADGTIHLTAVWFLFDESSVYIATSSQTKKARNILAKPKASLMVDLRNPATERGRTVACKAKEVALRRSLETAQPPHSQPLSQRRGNG